MVDSTYGMRLQGWGSNFFGAGIINGLALILMTYLFLNKRVRRLWCFTILYVFILVIGILIARTTLIGFLFSLFYLLAWKWKENAMDAFGVLDFIIGSIFYFLVFRCESRNVGV